MSEICKAHKALAIARGSDAIETVYDTIQVDIYQAAHKGNTIIYIDYGTIHHATIRNKLRALGYNCDFSQAAPDGCLVISWKEPKKVSKES